MVIHRHLMISAIALAVAAPLPAAAQQAATAQTSGPQGEAAGQTASRNQPQQASAPQHKTIAVMPAGQLVNRPLRDPRGQSAGRIDGIVLNTQTGAIDYVIIAGNGNFDLNGQVIAVPWSVLDLPIGAQGPITIKVDTRKLSQAPRLNPNALAALEQPRMRANIYRYWRGYGPYGCYGYAPGPYGCYGYGYRGIPGYYYAPYPGGPRPSIAANPGNAKTGNSAQNANPAQNNGGSGSSDTGQAANNTRRNAAEQAVQSGQTTQTGKRLVRNGLVIGPSGIVSSLETANTATAGAMRSTDVFGANGQHVGHVDRVMIAPRDGAVGFVLIKQNGFLGLSPHWYAVPVEALTWQPYQGGYRLTVNRASLTSEASVPVNEHALPTRVQANQLAQLYQRFDLRPYWEQGSGQQGGSGSASAAGSGGSHQPVAQ